MKKLTLIVMAGLLMLGLTQCKKEQSNTNAEGEWVDITVKVDGGDRHIVYPGTGAVVYSGGDVIYVGNGGKYVGQLTYANGAFSGSIYNPQNTDYLHFYFLGGKTPSATPTPGSTENFTVDISDQRGNLPVLSYGHSTQKYTPEKATYGCTLENQCALVKFGFDVNTEGTDLGVTVSGLQTTAAISFADPDNAITTATGTPGSIKLYHESNAAKWAILLPQAGVTGATANIGSSSYTVSAIPAVEANDYVTSDVNIYYNTLATPYVFTVAEGRTVQFSRGNLQYKQNVGWRFAEHQWDAILAWDDTDWVDLFCWGTWGFGKNPLNISKDDSDYTWSTDFAGTLDGHSSWRTLTNEEWSYLFEYQTTGCSTVAGMVGYVIRPNGVTTAIASSYTSDAWATEEANGSVFLPEAASRRGADLAFVGGRYWSSTGHESNNYIASYLGFYEPGWGMYYIDRSFGYSVRLVRDCE